jgi:hypothetical protein
LHFALRLLIAAAFLLTLEISGLWVSLISHDTWSRTATLQGIAGGAVLSLIGFRLMANRRITLLPLFIWAAAAFVVAYWVSWNGKVEWENSTAQNVLAGEIWFYGFKAVNLFAFCAVAFALSYRRARQ